MAKIAWGIGWSVSQAQGKMVRPTANMERAADHLRHKSLLSSLKVDSFDLLPNHSSPNMERRSAGNSRATDIYNPGIKLLMSLLNCTITSSWAYF